MLSYEKVDLRNQFDEKKHHAVTAMNILLFLERKGILKINYAESHGKKL